MLAMAKISAARKRHPEMMVSLSIAPPRSPHPPPQGRPRLHASRPMGRRAPGSPRRRPRPSARAARSRPPRRDPQPPPAPELLRPPAPHPEAKPRAGRRRPGLLCRIFLRGRRLCPALWAQWWFETEVPEILKICPARFRCRLFQSQETGTGERESGKIVVFRDLLNGPWD